ncbi:hypothetical protein BKI52_20140 [marine bacterium AO1-C]|nr:hypothetical protein BKI52_20140 [marine bacterium AO1-C]
MTPLVFEEKQQMIKTWAGSLVILLNVVFIGLLMRQLLTAPKTTTLLAYAITLFITLGIFWLFQKATLTTHLTREGITVHYPPFVKEKYFAWSTLSKVYTRNYKPLGEFGGWGYRNNGKSFAYNVSGNFGLQLEFKEEKNILIGSQKQEELAAFIQKLKDEGILADK